MRPLKVAVATSAAMVAAAGVALAHPHRREKARRTARVWRLTTRRSLHWLLVWVRGRAADEEARARLEERFAIRSAEDVARELGGMKGAIMKAGQMLSFLADGLPPEAQAALATLQADVPPMAPSLAEQVVREELGDEPHRLFLDWAPVPVAAASIGQVHRAVLGDGRLVAVKVQYPGIDRAIRSDLDNLETYSGVLASVMLKGLDVKPWVDEIRERMREEVDYRFEADGQAEFADRYRGHPAIAVPEVVRERTARRVLTSEWAEGLTFHQFLETATEPARQRAGEAIFRYFMGSIHHYRFFNGDPHPGNYRFAPDGSVTFLDFGLMKRWEPGELESITPVVDALVAGDADRTVTALVDGGFLRADHGLDSALVFEAAATPYRPLLEPEFTYRRTWVSGALARVLDLQGPYGDVLRAANMPPSYVILDRVVWGMSAILGHLRAHNRWGAILAEYREAGPPATEMGREEAAWRAAT